MHLALNRSSSAEVRPGMQYQLSHIGEAAPSMSITFSAFVGFWSDAHTTGSNINMQLARYRAPTSAVIYEHWAQKGKVSL